MLIIPIDSYFSEGWPNHQPVMVDMGLVMVNSGEIPWINGLVDMGLSDGSNHQPVYLRHTEVLKQTFFEALERALEWRLCLLLLGQSVGLEPWNTCLGNAKGKTGGKTVGNVWGIPGEHRKSK